MTQRILTPDEVTLRKFLLGTLPPEEAERVAKWVEETPIAAEVLRNINAHDTVVDAIGTPAADTSSASQLVHTSIQTTTPDINVENLPVEVGGYRVVAELGRGGMGIVLEAEDKHLNRRVAVKLIATEFATNPAARERFLREARAVAKVEHENVVPILHVGEDAGQLYLVMPLLKGETLDARLKREKRLPNEELVRIGREVAAGLAAAHAVELVHRDIKPANIWLEASTGHVKLLDFGLAKPSEQSARDANLTDTGAVMGTPHYMAPEQAEGKPVDSRTDLFSLGAVLYHAATGQRPFKGETKLAVLIAVTNETPPRAEKLNTSLPPRLAALLRALLEKNPKGRPASATEVMAELQPVAIPKAQRTRSARFPRWTTVAGLLAVAVLAATIVVIVRDKNGKEVARIEVPEGGKVEIEAAKSGAEKGKAGTPSAAKKEIPLTPGPATDPHRKAAVWLKELKGEAQYRTPTGTGGFLGRVESTYNLPPVFELTAIVIHGGNITDADLEAYLGRFDTLLGIDLASCARVTEPKFLAKHPKLLQLRLVNTAIGDSALEYISGFKYLAKLELGGTVVTDAGLTRLSACEGLTNLNLVKTKVTKGGVERLATILPRCQIAWDGGVIEPAGDRAVVELLLSIGGVVRVNDRPEFLKVATDLPPGPVRLNLVHVMNNKQVTDTVLAHLANRLDLTHLGLERTPVTDIGMAHLKDCKALVEVCLQYTATGDKTLAALAGCPNLIHLDVHGTQVTDAGLVHVKGWKKLGLLWLEGTKVTDAGLAHLHACDSLAALNLEKTEVTKEGVERLAKALPQCKIVWDGGIIEPKK